MKKTAFLLAALLMVAACEKEDKKLYTPQGETQTKRVIDTLYADLAEMAADNGYTDMQHLLESQEWQPEFEKTFLVYHPADTFYTGIFHHTSIWNFQFNPYPFNTNYITRRDRYENHVSEQFELYPTHLLVKDRPIYILARLIRYSDSTLSFDVVRNSRKDSLSTIDLARLQNKPN